MPANLNPRVENFYYSQQWAEHIVDQVREKYPRGTENFLEIFKVSTKQLARFLTHRDPLWPKLRLLIRFMEACHMNPKYKPTTEEIRRIVREHLQRIHEERLLGRLDEVEKQRMLDLQA